MGVSTGFFPRTFLESWVNIKSVKSDIFLTWTNVARTNQGDELSNNTYEFEKVYFEVQALNWHQNEPESMGESPEHYGTKVIVFSRIY